MWVVELSAETFPALERLFGPRGAVEGCWCMFFRQTAGRHRRNAGQANKEALRALATAGQPVGLLAIDGEDALGWVAVAPRPVHPRLDRSPVARPPDPAEDVSRIWSVTCFYVHRAVRGHGIARRLLDEAVRHAVRHGAWTVEAYPVDPGDGLRTAPGEAYHGTLGMFLDAGFDLVERRGVRRALVRKAVG